jgi:hypothetical protein
VEKLQTVHILPAMSRLESKSGEERAQGGAGPSEEGISTARIRIGAHTQAPLRPGD